MFEWAYDLNGNKTPLIKPLPIAAATVIDFGEIVDFTPGTGVVSLAQPTDFDDPAIGVAMQAHPANSGTLIKVSCSPTAVYRYNCTNIVTATNGSTTTFVVNGLGPSATDDIWIGGMLEVVTCANDPSMVGKKIPIIDYAQATGTLTIPEQPVAFQAGDTARLCPGPLAIGSYGWDLTADGLDVDWDTSGGESLILVDVDPANMAAYFMLRLHRFGNDAAAK